MIASLVIKPPDWNLKQQPKRCLRSQNIRDLDSNCDIWIPANSQGLGFRVVYTRDEAFPPFSLFSASSLLQLCYWQIQYAKSVARCEISFLGNFLVGFSLSKHHYHGFAFCSIFGIGKCLQVLNPARTCRPAPPRFFSERFEYRLRRWRNCVSGLFFSVYSSKPICMKKGEELSDSQCTG
jgi:hypothetical protein